MKMFVSLLYKWELSKIQYLEILLKNIFYIKNFLYILL